VNYPITSVSKVN